MNDFSLGSLENEPHSNLIREMTQKCLKDERIQAIWVGGSLATGQGDAYSDIDFRLAVEPGKLDQWTAPEWTQYFPIQPCGGVFMQFGNHALLHHLVLTDGTIVDFYVQDTEQEHFEPQIEILFCRNAEFQQKLEGFSRPATSLIKAIDENEVRRFLVDYWIITHKQMKAMARRYDLSPFVGLYWERLALLRAWHLKLVGKDIAGRASLHMLGALHQGLGAKLTEQQRLILGLPSNSPEETAVAIEAIRTEMVQVGRWLAEKHGFDYPHELEAVVLETWAKNKASLLKRP